MNAPLRHSRRLRTVYLLPLLGWVSGCHTFDTWLQAAYPTPRLGLGVGRFTSDDPYERAAQALRYTPLTLTIDLFSFPLQPVYLCAYVRKVLAYLEPLTPEERARLEAEEARLRGGS
ncbi:MAG: hypothetical protein R3F62_17450 [Planctomycetota bacterium]